MKEFLYLDKLTNIHDLFSRYFEGLGDVFICGGAVRDTLSNRVAKDYDVYLINPTDKWFSIAELIKERTGSMEKESPTLWFHQSEPFLVQSVLYNGDSCQIMLRHVKTVEELVDTFDWNVCLYAFGVDGIYVHPSAIDPLDIQVGAELKLNKITWPISTLRRGFRFSERFGMQLPRDTIKQICSKINTKRYQKRTQHCIETMKQYLSTTPS